MLLEGLHIPLTTPFKRDGSLDTQALAANVLRYSLTPAAGLIVLGPPAEPTLLNDEETREALRTAAQAATPEKVLIAAIARDSVAAAVELATFAADHGYDAILVAAPTVFGGVGRSRQRFDEMRLFFQAIADRSPLPVMLAHVTYRPPLGEVFSAVVMHPNIIGSLYTGTNDTAPSWQLTDSGLEPYSPGTRKPLPIHKIGITTLAKQSASVQREITVTRTFTAVTSRMKVAADAAPVPALVSASSLSGSGNTTAEPIPVTPALRTRTKSVGFQILSGSSGSLLDALNAGAVGIAPAFAAAAPQACYEIYAAWKDQDQPLASEKQQRLVEAAQLIDSLGPGALKFAADLNGYAGGFPRLPHLPLTGEQRDRIEQLMKPLHN